MPIKATYAELVNLEPKLGASKLEALNFKIVEFQICRVGPKSRDHLFTS